MPREPRQIRFDLTDEELGDRRRDLATAGTDSAMLERKLEPEVQQLNSLKAKNKMLAHAVANGYEFRVMELEKSVCEDEHLVKYYDPNGGELLDTRPMLPGDQQEQLV